MDQQIFLLVLVGVALCLLFILVLLWQLDRAVKTTYRLISGQEYLATQDRAYGLLQRAGKLAAGILGQAELSSVKVEAFAKWRAKKLSENLEKEISDSASLVEKTFLSEAARANDEFKEYLSNLRTETSRVSETLIGKEQDDLSRATAEFKEEMAKIVADLGLELRSKVVEQIDSAKKEVDQYKASRMAQIDKEAISIIEEATAYVLSKKMTLAGQIDLISEALEKAKEEKLIS